MGNDVKTIYDISKEAGVSIATVSRVLNGSHKVSAKTKEKVLNVMEKYEYRPNAFARGLGTGSMRTIGIMCSDVADIYLASAVSFLERELKKQGFYSVLCCSGYEYESKVKSLENLENNKVDAVILVGSQYIEKDSTKNNYIKQTSERIPVMLLNGYLKGKQIYCNLSDDYEAYADATERLIAAGARNILFLYREETFSMIKKKKGYCAALEEHCIACDDQLIFCCNDKVKIVKANLIQKYEELLRDGKRIDAVIATDDEMAIAALKFAKEKNLRVPEELAIVGCNNSVLAISTEPELSSIDNKCELLCVNTVSTLMRVLNKQEASNKTVVMTEFVERKTTNHEFME